MRKALSIFFRAGWVNAAGLLSYEIRRVSLPCTGNELPVSECGFFSDLVEVERQEHNIGTVEVSFGDVPTLFRPNVIHHDIGAIP